ncbi:hypothetical protein H4R33_000106 [Dimargaris cristalligena]|uniref:Uncharacterized protein n=1 Tax=Dimargaris cristalligena TaxID=215637 RepID=A0A4P9ZTD0_9FUNG|nr:hypothetical protein H4R33_000106 [Dimargaris cristalligena]RKP36468.1 hypothetical protein BJ085DRAFT_16711 [Dimargaris cristalligena]|eukprot:RKP36468.1 hypothetical protein BJ085DRAFT_16711 [Dimargaris cristalligena]
MAGPAPTPKYSVDDLLAKAQANLDQFQHEVAYRFCQKAVELDPLRADALEALAAIELELGQFELALGHWQRCVELQPDQGAAKYMYLGQMTTEMDSIRYFEKGLTLLRQERETNPAPELNSKIATALCSITEIYLTDCCFQPEAESCCEKYLEEAATVDPSNPEVYQLLASVRLSQQRSDEAKAALLKSISIWSALDINDPAYPSYDSRIATVKILLELNLFDDALGILAQLQLEDDQTVDLWYLFGWAYYCMAEEAQAGAKPDTKTKTEAESGQSLLTSSAECLTKALQLYQAVGFDDVGILNHAQELLATIGQVIPLDSIVNNPDGDVEEDGGPEDEVDWEDMSSSDEKPEEDSDMALDA